MQFRSVIARAAGAALLTACLVACADSTAATAPATAADASLRTVVTPLALTTVAGTPLRTVVSVENLGDDAASGVAKLCLADANTPGCGVQVGQIALPSIAVRDVHVDTALVALPLPAPYADVPQRLRVRACTAATAGAAATTCASSAVVTVMPNFEAACGVTALAVGDSVTGTGAEGTCTLSSTGDKSRVFAVQARGNDTLLVTFDGNGICGAGVAAFDRDGAIIEGHQLCGPATSMKVPVALGGTYHIAVGGAIAGYGLKVEYVPVTVPAGDETP